MSLGLFGLTTKSAQVDPALSAAGDDTYDVINAQVGAQAATVSLRFAYGSGGTSVKAYVQTSFDGGQSWVDLACVVFLTASLTKILNFTGMDPVTAFVPTDGAMSDDTQIDGPIGDRFRIRRKITGTYAGSTQLIGRLVSR